MKIIHNQRRMFKKFAPTTPAMININLHKVPKTRAD